MSANVEIKKQVVSEITERIQNAKSVVLVKFAGLTVAEDTAIRNEFRKAEVEYKVYKNTLIKKAFENLGVNSFDADDFSSASIFLCTKIQLFCKWDL